MLGRRLADYIRLVRSDNLFLFVGRLSLVRSMGPELLTIILYDDFLCMDLPSSAHHRVRG